MNEKVDNVDKENNENEVTIQGVVIMMMVWFLMVIMMIIIVPFPIQGESSKIILMEYFDEIRCNAFVWSGSHQGWILSKSLIQVMHLFGQGRGGERG